jgi:hypothetical protein
MSKYQSPDTFSTTFSSGPCAGRTAPLLNKPLAHRGQHPNGPSLNPQDPRRQLEFQTTHDLDDGQPCPPYFEGVPWRIVMRAGDHTIWSRPAFSTASGTAWRSAPEDQHAPTATSK